MASAGSRSVAAQRSQLIGRPTGWAVWVLTWGLSTPIWRGPFLTFGKLLPIFFQNYTTWRPFCPGNVAQSFSRTLEMLE